MRLTIVALASFAALSFGCLSMLGQTAGGGGKRLRVLNTTSLKLCSVALITDLDPDAGPSSNRLVNRMNGVPPGAEGDLQIPVYAGPEKPTTFGIRAYACKGSSMEPGALVAEIAEIDIDAIEPIVLR